MASLREFEITPWRDVTLSTADPTKNWRKKTTFFQKRWLIALNY